MSKTQTYNDSFSSLFFIFFISTMDFRNVSHMLFFSNVRESQEKKHSVCDRACVYAEYITLQLDRKTGS